MSVRVIDAGTVSYLRSQSLYHGLAYARSDTTPDTIVLCTPGEPYVCIGFHQDLEREIDLEFCGQEDLPVVRRETGGGAVYLDRDQLFVQWIMGADSLPPSVEARFELFCGPLIETYRELGIDAFFRPPNDVHVGVRKIVGTGAAHIGNAEVVTGNYIFDFDTEVMAKVLSAPSKAFRQQVRRSLEMYMTSVRAEIGRVPETEGVKSLYLEKCRKGLGRDPLPGELTRTELTAIEEVEKRFRSQDWIGQPGGMRRPGVKIHADVSVVESVVGPIRVTARLREGRIEEISLDGVSGGDALAVALEGVELQMGPVTEAVGQELAPVIMGLASV